MLNEGELKTKLILYGGSTVTWICPYVGNKIFTHISNLMIWYSCCCVFLVTCYCTFQTKNYVNYVSKYNITQDLRILLEGCWCHSRLRGLCICQAGTGFRKYKGWVSTPMVWFQTKFHENLLQIQKISRSHTLLNVKGQRLIVHFILGRSQTQISAQTLVIMTGFCGFIQSIPSSALFTISTVKSMQLRKCC